MSLLSGMDDIIAALGKTNRVYQVFLENLAVWQLVKVLAAMQVPFPELTRLRLYLGGETPPVAPDSFLGASFWVDLPHVCKSASWMAFHSRDCQNCFCPLLTLSSSA